ncbi:hypothetical protein Dimus_031775 [Dionaea muscipula]
MKSSIQIKPRAPQPRRRRPWLLVRGGRRTVVLHLLHAAAPACCCRCLQLSQRVRQGPWLEFDRVTGSGRELGSPAAGHRRVRQLVVDGHSSSCSAAMADDGLGERDEDGQLGD